MSSIGWEFKKYGVHFLISYSLNPPLLALRETIIKSTLKPAQQIKPLNQRSDLNL